jgi:hypothetical protein
MKQLVLGAVCAAVTATAMAADVGVSINIGQPGFYGQINIGDVPQPPPVLYAQPVVIERGPDYVAEPIYLNVPPGYERHWARHCHEYHACGRRVYFVNRDWYQREYVPHYQRGEWGHPRGEDYGRDERRDHQNRGHEEGRGHEQGPGRDQGRGHDQGHGHDQGRGKGDDHGRDRGDDR